MSVLSDLFDEARGVFKDVADFELGRLQIQLAKDANALEASQIRDQAPRTTASAMTVPVWVWPVVAGAGIVGAIAVLKR